MIVTHFIINPPPPEGGGPASLAEGGTGGWVMHKEHACMTRACIRMDVNGIEPHARIPLTQELGPYIPCTLNKDTSRPLGPYPHLDE